MISKTKEEAMREKLLKEEVALYSEDQFKNYWADKYDIASKDYLQNNTILKMIYAMEWFEIKKSNKFDLIRYHPNIIHKDYEAIEDLRSQHRLDVLVSATLFAIVTNRLIHPKVSRKVFRYPFSLAISGVLTLGFSHYVLTYFMNSEITKKSLDKYFDLPYDADMMRKDLEEIGIKIKAKYYNKEEVQKHVDEKDDK